MDTVAYSGSDEAVTVDLEEGTGEGGHAEGDVITDIKVVFGSRYGDVLVGDDSANQLFSNAGDDELRGGAGDDTLTSDAGDDALWGGAGNDWLDGGAGNDRFSGGGGGDIFGFDFGHSDDIITDFTDGEDLIAIYVSGLSGFDELVVSSDPDGVTIDLMANGGGTIRLEGFDIADLDAGDFSFA